MNCADCDAAPGKEHAEGCTIQKWWRDHPSLMTEHVKLVMLMGGPADGRVINFDTNQNVLYWPKAVDLFGNTPLSFPDRYEVYNYRQIYTPDSWLQVVLVHNDVDPAIVPESELIRAIMTVWRAKHREQAESGLGHAPSGFAVTEEMLRDQPSIVDRIMRHGRA